MQNNSKENRKTADSNNDDYHENPELERFRFLLQSITEEYLNKFEEIQGKKKKDAIPVNIFNKKISPLETVVKYLKENSSHTLKEISVSLNRSVKTVWQAYNNSKKKFPERFKETYSEQFISVNSLKNRKLSILESVVTCLKENSRLNYHQIAKLLERDDRTIWTVYNRSKKKRNIL